MSNRNAIEPVHAYTPSNAEEQHLTKYYDLFEHARNDRAHVDKFWESYERQWEGYFTDDIEDQDRNGSGEYRSNVWVPLTFSLVMTAMAEYIQQNPTIVTLPRSEEDVPYAEIKQEIMGSSFRKGNFLVELYRAFLDASIFGTCPIYEYYRCDVKEIKELSKFDPQSMKYEYQKKKRKEFDDVFAESFSPYHWYPRPFATNMENIGWAFRRYIFDETDFKNHYYDKFANAKYVKPAIDHLSNDPDWAWWDTTGMQYLGEDQVEVLWGWNEWEDEMVIMANGVLLSKPDMPIVYNHKKVPVALIHSTMRSRRLWGKSMCEILEKLQFELNVNRNLSLDQHRLNILKIMFINSAAGFTEEQLQLKPGVMIPVKGDPREAVYPLEYGGLKSERYNEEELLNQDASKATGISPELTGVEKAESATQAAIMKESSLKRINLQMILAYADGLTRLGRLRNANINQFYTQPTKVQEVVGTDGTKRIVKEYRRVILKDKALAFDPANQNYYLQKDFKGFSDFMVTPDLLKETNEENPYYDHDIEIDPQSSIRMSEALRLEREKEFYTETKDDPYFDPVKIRENYLRSIKKSPEELMARAMQGNGPGMPGMPGGGTGGDADIAAQIVSEVMGGMGAPQGGGGALPGPRGGQMPPANSSSEAVSRVLPNFGGAGI